MLRSSRVGSFLIVPIAFALLGFPASAAPVLYTDRSSWETATSGIFTVDFEGLATQFVPGDFSSAGGYTTGGLQFIGLTPPASYYLYAEDPNASQNYNWGTSDVLMGPNAAWGGGYIQVNMPSGGVTALASNVMTHTPFAAPVIVTLSTGDSYTITTFQNPYPAFVGFTSTTPITFVRFTPTSGFPMIDNFSYGTAGVTETPEADTLILGGTGLLGLLIARGMKRWVA